MCAPKKSNREQESPQTQEEGQKAKQRRQEDGTEMTTERPADERGKQEGSNWTDRAAPTKGQAREKGKSFQYVCPHCDQSVTSTTRTGQVDHCRTCGNRFRVREGRVFCESV